ncbi:MurR/RpiR family transcriptional regulator, partial [Citrobacter arsenatis]
RWSRRGRASADRRLYVVITDMRAYSAISRQYCRVATERCIPLALITDVWCPWARDYSIDLLQVKTDTGHFWDSLAPVSCLFNLLLSAVVAQLGDALAGRLQTNRQLQQQFGQFEQ